MRDARIERLAAAVAARQDDLAFRRAYADLRETVAWTINPRQADRDLARLLTRFAPGPTPIAERFEAVLGLLPEDSLPSGGGQGRGLPAGYGGDREEERGKESLLADGLETLLNEHCGLSLADAAVLDPWAGDGKVIAAVTAHAGFGPRQFANEAEPQRYARAAARLGASFGGLCLADSFRLPERKPTPGFDFSDDENTERIARQQAAVFTGVVSDLRAGKTEACVRWMAGRLAPEGVIAFLSGGDFIDEPSFGTMRAWLEDEFALVAHLALSDGPALTFLVRGGGSPRILYARAETPPEAYGEIEWNELQPTDRHVWRTEILRPEWAGFLPLAGERGAIFGETNMGFPDGRDAAVPGSKLGRRVLRRPFAPAWRTFDRKVRREPLPPDRPTIVVLGERFGILASRVPVDRRFGGPGASVRAACGSASASAMRRFRTAYGAGVVEHDVFDATLALLHHPEYRTRYHEDLRRSLPRLPLPSPERLAALTVAEGAPPVGPGTAFGTGWLDPDLFEPGTLPDYDDPFASPYARADVEPGFLLLVGLGAALERLQTDFERMIPHPLRKVGEAGPKMRLSADRTRVVGVLEEIPHEASNWRIGRRTALEWVVEATHAKSDFDPLRPEDPDRPLRLIGQVVTAALEVDRLVEVLNDFEI